MCTTDGVTVGRRSVAARVEGVALRVSSSMPTETYLTYTSEGGPAGGDVLPEEPATWTMQLPPGELALACMGSGADDPGEPTRVQVTDPMGYWRGALPANDCGPGGSQPSWIAGLEASGDTAEAAVDGVLANFTRKVPATYAAYPVEVGYPGAATQTWVATKDGRANMTILATHEGSTYSARPDALCGPG